MTPLTEFYKALLHAVDCVVGDDDYIFYQPLADKDPIPITIRVGKKDRTLVLPTKRILKDGDWNEVVAFHPVCESIFAGQSEVLNHLLALAGFKLHESIQRAVASIISLGINPDLRNKLSLKQSELLGKFEDFDASVEKLALDIVKKNTGITGKHPLISLKLDRGGEIDGEIYSRTCTVMAHVLNHKDTFCGVTSPSVKAKKTIRNIYEYVFPEQRIYGSNSADMPYLIATLLAFYKTAIHLNKIKTLLGKHTTMLEIPVSWFEQTKELHKLSKRYLPQPLPGNTGININATKAKVDDTEEVITDEYIPASAEKVTLASDEPKLTALGLVRLKPAAKPTVAPQQMHNGLPPSRLTQPVQPLLQPAQATYAYPQPVPQVQQHTPSTVELLSAFAHSPQVPMQQPFQQQFIPAYPPPVQTFQQSFQQPIQQFQRPIPVMQNTQYPPHRGYDPGGFAQAMSHQTNVRYR